MLQKLPLAFLLLLVSCSEEQSANIQAQEIRVRVIAEAEQYDRPNGEILSEPVPIGTEGVLRRENPQWVEVLFDDFGINSLVKAETVERISIEGFAVSLQEARMPGTVTGVGFVGCSNTKQMASVLNQVSPAWASIAWTDRNLLKSLDGGSLGQWVPGSMDPGGLGSGVVGRQFTKLWNYVNAGFQMHPNTNTIVWEICVHDREALGDQSEPFEFELDWGVYVLGRLLSDHPGIRVYISGLNRYVNPGSCERVGLFGTIRASGIAAHLSDMGGYQFQYVDLQGNTVDQFGPFGGSDLASDGCHLSAGGSKKKAEQLVSFLDTL